MTLDGEAEPRRVLDELVFRRAADSAVDGVAIVGLDRRILYANEARAQMHGYTRAELIGRDVSVLSAPAELAVDISAQVLRDGLWRGELDGLRKDGSTFPMRQTITRVDDAGGTPIAMLSVTRDITQEKATAEVISRSEETLRLVVEGSPDFFFYIHNAEGVFTYISPSVEAITGYSAQEWMSHYTRFLTDNPINRDVVRLTENTLKTGEITPFYPVEVYHKDGRRITLEVYERPIFRDGEVVGIRGVARDVTELRRAEAAERALREEAEQHKRRFYRDTILSVTDGKLIVCDHGEIDVFCCRPVVSALPIAQPQHVAVARDEVKAASLAAGMDPSRIDDLALCVGEAATNAYKHAGGGILAFGDEGDVVRVKVVDSGPGMDSLALPRLTLMKGYSTAHSLGMGYAAMLALADKIYLATDPNGTTVVIEFAKQPRSAALDLAVLPDLW